MRPVFAAAADSDQLPVLVCGSDRRWCDCAAAARQNLAAAGRRVVVVQEISD